MRCLRTKFIFSLFLHGSFVATSVAAARIAVPTDARPAQVLLARAQKDFAEGRYDKSRDGYRKYLRKNVRDADAWVQLGAAIFYCGEAEKAYYYLKKWEDKAKSKSYALYYQGLALLELDDRDKAKIALAKSAAFVDEYAARSTFELAVIEYNNHDEQRSQYWINLYKQRYGQGAYLQQILQMEQSLRSKTWLPDQLGNRRPNRIQSLFKFHPYSLSNAPHYWFANIGYLFNSGDVVDPDSQSATGTKPATFENHDLIIRTGVGIGPMVQQNFQSYFGYTYQQDWITTRERYEDFMSSEDFLDYFKYWPFRADLMERTHRVYAQLDYDFGKYGLLGTDVFQEYSFIGSRLIPVASGSEAEQYSAQTREANLLKPYFRMSFFEVWDLTFYMYFYKQLELLAPEMSYKTYSFNDSIVLSYGLSQEVRVPSLKLVVNADVFQYEFIYNDYWLDFTRLGGMLGADIAVEGKLRANLAAGYYEDTYQMQMLRMGSCVFRKRDANSPSSNEVQSCPRKDTGTLLQAGLSYDFTAFTRANLKFTMIENKNPTLTIYEQSENIVEFNISMAFPDVQRTKPFIEKFGDILRSKRIN